MVHARQQSIIVEDFIVRSPPSNEVIVFDIAIGAKISMLTILECLRQVREIGDLVPSKTTMSSPERNMDIEAADNVKEQEGINDHSDKRMQLPHRLGRASDFPGW